MFMWLGFFRFFLGLVIILPYIIKKKDAVLKTTHLKQHFLRAILGLPAMLLYFSALVTASYRKAYSNIICCSFNCNNTCSIFFRRENLYL